MKYVLTLIAVLFFSLGYCQEQDAFKNANTLYKTGDYTGAVKAYDALVNAKTVSAELFFNLGNTHYKLNNTAKSIYNYEKALQLNPKDESIIQNLAFANNMKIDAIEVLPEIGYSKYFNKFARAMNTDTWAILSIVACLLFILSVILYFYTNNTAPKRAFFISSFGTSLFCLFCLSVAYYKDSTIDHKVYAIVFAKESKLKTEANFKSEDALILHEGTKVLVVEKDKNWLHIKLTDGKTGWLLKDDLKLLNNF